MHRYYACLLSLAACLLALPCAAVVGGESLPRRPNVVILLADDMAWTDYGLMGHKTIQTPHLDKLASESLVYTRGYVPTSLCRSSLMTLVTGRYPHEHGITGNDPPKGTPREALLKFVKGQPTVPRVLAERGYRTFQSGKWWEGSHQDGGFTHGMTHGDPTRGGRHGDDGLKIGRQGLQPIFDFIEESQDQPFFVWYAPLLPHSPHNPPERLLAKYRDKVDSLHVAKYYAMCEWWDETCGALLTYLDEKKLSENTLVVYACDNGWIQSTDKPAFAPRSKRSPYEMGVRTPLMFRWPGKVKPQRVEDRSVSSIHIAATILNACDTSQDAAWRKTMHAGNLLDASAKAAPVFGELYAHDVADVDAPAKSLEHRWVIDGNWKLILPTSGAAELYDLSADPHEARNLAAERGEDVQRLTRQLDAWWLP